MPKLSIIIPCYNCEVTLRESVDSCYTQEMELPDFEIIMVDDGSKDGTRALMQQLATEHTNITLLFHPENRGGGAARNTGIKQSSGELIYCLDSDNVFAPDSIKPMLAHLESTGADGVAFYERRFFFANNLHKYRAQKNDILDRAITLQDIFKQPEPLLDNFIYTKTSYQKTNGYPEHHGFDTQCFELRYLAAGNKVHICPDAIFYHRQGMRERSYFERVHASGMFSVNFMLIYEELLHILKPAVCAELVTFPLFSGNTSYGTNVNAYMKNRVLAGEDIFIENYETYLTADGLQKWVEDHPALNEDTLLPHIIAADMAHTYLEVQTYLSAYLRFQKNVTPYIAFLSLRITHGLTGMPHRLIIKQSIAAAQQLQLKPHLSRGGFIGDYLRRNKYTYPIIRCIHQLVR